jgi:hypothetical protein
VREVVVRRVRMRRACRLDDNDFMYIMIDFDIFNIDRFK